MVKSHYVGRTLVHAGSDIDPDTLQELNERQVIEVMWQAWKHSDGHLVHEIAPLVLTQLSLNPNRFYAVVAPDSTGFDLFLQLMESTCFRNWDDTVTSHMRRYKRYILNLLSNAKKMMISI